VHLPELIRQLEQRALARYFRRPAQAPPHIPQRPAQKAKHRLHRFPDLPDDAFLSYEEAQQIATAVLEAVNDRGGLKLVGEPGEQPEDLPRVRVRVLREGLRQVAKRAGLDIADVWARAAQQAIAAAAWQQERYERLEACIPEWRAFRVMPREQELGWIMRYEAHLSRELARLLKDFHLLQRLRHSKGERGEAKGEMGGSVVSGQWSVISPQGSAGLLLDRKKSRMPPAQKASTQRLSPPPQCLPARTRQQRLRKA
jgi:hypothetical protein